MIRWTGLAPWGFEFPFPGSLISTFLELLRAVDPQQFLKDAIVYIDSLGPLG